MASLGRTGGTIRPIEHAPGAPVVRDDAGLDSAFRTVLVPGEGGHFPGWECQVCRRGMRYETALRHRCE